MGNSHDTSFPFLHFPYTYLDTEWQNLLLDIKVPSVREVQKGENGCVKREKKTLFFGDFVSCFGGTLIETNGLLLSPVAIGLASSLLGRFKNKILSFANNDIIINIV